MQINMTVKITGNVSDREAQNYVDYLEEKYNRKLQSLDIKADGDEVDLKFRFDAVPFERIRRITGYLVGTMDHWNDAKRAEEADRVKHIDIPEIEPKEVPIDLREEQKQFIPDKYETGEMIKTPRGTFYITDMTQEQMNAAGYSFHHESDDGKYLIMTNGTRGFAIAAKEPEKDL